MCNSHTAIQDYNVMYYAAVKHQDDYKCAIQCSISGRWTLIAFYGNIEADLTSFVDNYCGGLVWQRDRNFLTVFYPEVH